MLTFERKGRQPCDRPADEHPPSTSKRGACDSSAPRALTRHPGVTLGRIVRARFHAPRRPARPPDRRLTALILPSRLLDGPGDTHPPPHLDLARHSPRNGHSGAVAVCSAFRHPPDYGHEGRSAAEPAKIVFAHAIDDRTLFALARRADRRQGQDSAPPRPEASAPDVANFGKWTHRSSASRRLVIAVATLQPPTDRPLRQLVVPVVLYAPTSARFIDIE